MIAIGQERSWRMDTNHEHFIIIGYENGLYQLEYLTNGRIIEKTEEDLIKNSSIEEHSSFEYADCQDIVTFQSGKTWLYTYRCRTCQWRVGCCPSMGI